jgi:hypothetical protein
MSYRLDIDLDRTLETALSDLFSITGSSTPRVAGQFFKDKVENHLSGRKARSIQ